MFGVGDLHLKHVAITMGPSLNFAVSRNGVWVRKVRCPVDARGLMRYLLHCPPCWLEWWKADSLQPLYIGVILG